MSSRESALDSVAAPPVPRKLADSQPPASVFEYCPNLRRVRRFVLDHLADNITLGEAASAAGLERKYFSTFFHRRVGIRFRDWLCAMRISRAMVLIKTEDYSLTLVGDLVGFGDRRTFQRAFKKWVGVTPSEFHRRTTPGPDWSDFAKLLRGGEAPLRAFLRGPARQRRPRKEAQAGEPSHAASPGRPSADRSPTG